MSWGNVTCTIRDKAGYFELVNIHQNEILKLNILKCLKVKLRSSENSKLNVLNLKTRNKLLRTLRFVLYLLQESNHKKIQ